MTNLRTISQIIEPQYVIEGAGVLLRRSVAPHKSNLFDPFLLFDHFAFNDPIEGPIRGFPMHPHRGIETVTYMLEGSTHHRDSLGNAGLIGPGDVQWMTSGRGILHEEMPRRGESGNIYGFQLWVNLPKRLKMTEPRYQEVNADSIPTYEKDGIKIRVVAGQVDGISGPVTEIAASPLYIDVALPPDKEFIQPIPSGHTAIAYVFEGEGVFAGQTVEAVRLVKFEDGDSIHVKTENHAVRFMLIAGQPFKEPIAPYGPFVMNTMEEIQQTLIELRNGTFIK
ncbi:MAG TPA: pirin family protein [Anaerolineales bacterium]|jgi:redox-sensitive bicupin YhaK (pirin superfamily)|nr:pirin family protein [Anaerolineales bacterium]